MNSRSGRTIALIIAVSMTAAGSRAAEPEAAAAQAPSEKEGEEMKKNSGRHEDRACR